MNQPGIQELHESISSSTIRRFCDQWQISEYDLPQWFRDNPSLSPYKCPRCFGVARWRSGQGFDHMMRCGKCGIVWTPDSVLRMKDVLTEELSMMLGDGI